MLEICRQSCLLPMEHMDTIKKSVTFFRKLFLVSDLRKVEEKNQKKQRKIEKNQEKSEKTQNVFRFLRNFL